MKIKKLTPTLSNGVGGNHAHWLLALLLLVVMVSANAQDDETYTDDDTISSITATKYKQNPAKYLKYIDSTKIPTGILIDRVKFRTDMGLFNGKSKVKTGDYYIWKRIYNSLKYSNNDTGYIPPVDMIREVALSMIRSENQLIPIGIINMKYNKIAKKSLASLIDKDSCLLAPDTANNILKPSKYALQPRLIMCCMGRKLNFWYCHSISSKMILPKN